MTGVTEHLRPEEGAPLSQEEFARSAGMTPQQVRELADYGLLPPQKMTLAWALAMREAVRLQDDFDLDLFATGLVGGYIEKIHELQSELRRAHAEQPARMVVTEVSFTSVTVRGGP